MRTVFLLACSLAATAGLGVALAQSPNPNPSPAGKACQLKCYNEEKQCEARLPNPASTTQYYACTGTYGTCMQACPQ
jgi:hypothetical protein